MKSMKTLFLTVLVVAWAAVSGATNVPFPTYIDGLPVITSTNATDKLIVDQAGTLKTVTVANFGPVNSTSDQTIGGVKTFTSNIVGNITGNATTIGGFAPSQAPTANQVPVLDTNGNLQIPNHANLILDGAEVGLQMLKDGSTVSSGKTSRLTSNAYYFQGNWYRYDIAHAANTILSNYDGNAYVLTAPAGANPITWSSSQIIWHSGNDGTGSGLDADIVRGDRTVRGTIAANGTILSGTGFTVNKIGTGVYTITFTANFSVAPTVTFSVSDSSQPTIINKNGVSTSNFGVTTWYLSGSSVKNAYDVIFDFIATGTN